MYRILVAGCKAGGDSMGYHRAGFDVTGVDIEPQKNYPFTFIQADVFDLDPAAVRADYDAVAASPICQRYSRATSIQAQAGYPDSIPPMREWLTATGLPWIMENVPGAPLRPDYELCGCMFGLAADGWEVQRERWFETSWHGFDLRQTCYHVDPIITVSGKAARVPNPDGTWPGHKTRSRAMGIDWMTSRELSQALPPIYGEYMAGQLLNELAH